MCDDTNVTSKRHKKHLHSHQIKIFKCRTHQLCVFSFIVYCTTCGLFCNAYHLPINKTELHEDFKTVPVEGIKHDNNADTVTSQSRSNHSGIVQCTDSGCYIKISSSEQALEKMMSASLHLYKNYANSTASEGMMTSSGLKNLVEDLRPKEKIPEPTPAHNHDHDHKDEIYSDHDHKDEIYSDHDYEEEIYSEEEIPDQPMDQKVLDALYFMWMDGYSETNTSTEEIPCYNSVKELTEAYFKPSKEQTQLTWDDFITILPQIVLDITRPECEERNHNDNTEEKSAIKANAKYVWLISFASVTVISVISLCGVLTIPLLRYSKILNHVIAYLVALAVGTLCGDALLHLLPQAAGMHDHSSGSGHGSDHFDFMWKGLVACAGIYFFFILETAMSFIHRCKEKCRNLRKHSRYHGNGVEHDCDAESSSNDETHNTKQVNSAATPSGSPLLKETVKYGGEAVINITPLIDGIGACNHGEHDSKPDNHRASLESDEEPLDTGHHHHHHSKEVPKTVTSLAWMVIVGDGLHNITDGLAIGAAFTSSIGAGLGTVLAIFCHEIPQELADFAVLLEAGMTARQALLWNFLSACMCFIGLIIGLVVGEHTNGIILWILAFTAGGFLYIALVDMVPALMKQLSQKGYKLRYVIQNAGILTGFGMMVLIALKEDTFESYF